MRRFPAGALAIAFSLAASSAGAHSAGDLDRYGCHDDRRNGQDIGQDRGTTEHDGSLSLVDAERLGARSLQSDYSVPPAVTEAMAVSSRNVPSYPQSLWITLCRKLCFWDGAARNRRLSCVDHLVISDLCHSLQSLAVTS